MSQSRSFVNPIALATIVAGALLPGCSTKQADDPGVAQHGVLVCPATPAPALFDNALYLCDDLHLVGSALNTKKVGNKLASVGVNGSVALVGENHVDGDFIAKTAIHGTGDLAVSGDLRTAGSFDAVGTIHAMKDLWIGGDLSKVGDLIVDGMLRLAGADMEVGERAIGGTAAYSDVAAPCGCDGPNMLDVGKAVSDAKTANDNVKIGLADAILSVGDATIELPTGVYYLDSIRSVGSHHLRATGAVALNIAGDVDLVGQQAFELSGAGASLDLYVSGSLHTVGSLKIGDQANPGMFRLYVGGAGTVMANVGDQELNAMIYAPTAIIHWVGETRVRGAIFAKGMDGVGDMTIEYDGGTLAQPIACNPQTPAATPGDDQPVFVQ